MTTDRQHISVLPHEAVEALNVHSDGVYIDATFGRGGHSGLILKRLDVNGRLLALDCDHEAVEHANKLYGADNRFSIARCNYSEMAEAAAEYGITDGVHGVLFDLGVSSPQIDQPERGFSFDKSGPLDMRMDRDRGQPVSQWLQTASSEELAEVFRDYGDERYAKRIARKVVESVQAKPITDTVELAEIIKAAHPRWEKHKHPATRCFQALRIFINRELDHLKVALQACVDLLRPGGRLVVISFHSLEDRIVKRFFRGPDRNASLPRGLPVVEDETPWVLRKIGGSIRPSQDEVDGNPRARSSIMRIAERVA